jgi:phage tail-like protein
MPENIGFQYLNVGGEWPSFQLNQLVIGPDRALRLTQNAAQQYVAFGSALGGPFSAAVNSTDWFRLRAILSDVPADTHVQLFTLTNDGAAPPYASNSPNPFSGAGWNSIPRDLLEGIVQNPPAANLWVGLLLEGTPTATPVIDQLRVDYGRNTYLSFLPSLYSQDVTSRDFLQRFLALAASALGGPEAQIEDLPLLFDAQATPAPDWLAWLATWLDFPLNGNWNDAKARQYLSRAFDLYALRGTVRGLREMIKRYAGVNARIFEPARHASLWTLSATSTLGVDTMLSPTPVQGAVLGATASLDRSRLTADESGAILFEDLAHTFCVEVYASELTHAGALQSLREVIDREKPAHTVYRLSIIEPGLSIGWQARVGVDSILGEGLPPLRLGQPLGQSSLAATAAPCPSEVV